mgnify:CR=1 FL=1
MVEETTTVRLSKESSRKLDQIVKAVRIYTKKSLLEDLIEVLHQAIQRELGKSNGDRLILLAKPRYQKHAVLIPIASVEFVSGKIEVPMDISDQEADSIVKKEIEQKFRTIKEGEKHE